MHRRFYLYRPTYINKVPTGVLGEGVVWSDGTVSVRWMVTALEAHITANWNSLERFKHDVADPSRITIIAEDPYRPFEGEEVVNAAAH